MNYLLWDVDYENIGRNREVDLNHINEEVNLIQEYKLSFDEVLSIINDGTAEQLLIDEENSW